VEFLNDHEAAAYAIADNRLTEKNPMDAALVAEIFVELDAADVSLEGLGYADQELTAMLDPVGVDDVKWKEFDESVGNDAPKGKEIKCPHCGETFNK
jgi:formylmethanofuran dehydrogenase subunit E